MVYFDHILITYTVYLNMLSKTATRVRQAVIWLMKMFVTIEPHGIFLRKHARAIYCDIAIFHGCKKCNFQVTKCNYFLIFAQNIDCGHTIEPLAPVKRF